MWPCDVGGVSGWHTCQGKTCAHLPLFTAWKPVLLCH
jgi:hypothetical protein